MQLDCKRQMKSKAMWVSDDVSGIIRGGLLVLAIPATVLLMGGNCIGHGYTEIAGCPEEDVPVGTSFTLTATVTDAEGNDITADATFTYEVIQGPQAIAITGQGNSRTIEILDDAPLGAVIIEIGETSGLAYLAVCEFNVIVVDGCTTDADCDDGDTCTMDACKFGGCENAPLNCRDGRVCTDDRCDPATGCVHENTCPGDAPACTFAGCVQCRSHSDCAGLPLTPFCVSGDCVECRTVEDCDLRCGEYCEDGICVEGDGCDDDFDCEDGLACSNNSCDFEGNCAIESLCPEATPFCTAIGCVACRTNEDCDVDEGEWCFEGLCGCDGCEDDADCNDGLFCNGIESCSGGECGLCMPGADPCVPFNCCGDDQAVCLEGDGAAVCECPPRACFEFTLGKDCLVGTSDDDTLGAPLEFDADSGTQMATLQTGDAAEGLAGLDVLDVTFSNNTGAATTVVPANLGGIEILNISDFGDDDSTLDGLNVSGVEEINSVNSTSTVFVNNLASAAALGLENTGEGIEAEFESKATNRPDDELIINLRGSNQGSYVEVETAANGFEAAVISSLTTNNIIEEIGQTASTTLVAVSFFGDMHVELRNTDPSVVDFDGSGMTGGGFTLGEGNGSARDPYDDFHFGTNSELNTIVGSPGPDVVIFGSTFDSNDASGSGESIDLGDGMDVFQASLGATVGGVLPVQNTEELVLNSNAGGGAQVNLTGVLGIMNVFVAEDGASHGLTLLNIGATSGAFPALSYRGDREQAAQIFDNVTYQAAGATGGGDTLTVNVANRGRALNASGTANEYTFATLIAPAMENLVLTVADGPLHITTGITASTLANATFTASGNLNAGTLATNGSDTLLSITASAVTGKFTVTSNDMDSGSSITTGAGDDTVTVGDSGSDSSVVTLGDGNDIYTTTDADSQDVINSGAGNDLVTAGGGNDVVTTGSGPDDVVYNQTAAGNRSDVSDFTTGTGGDRMVFDENDLGLAVGSIFAGAVGGVGAQDVLIITGSTYATDAAAAAAVAGASAVAAPGVIVYFNITDSTTNIIRVTNLDTGAGDTHIGTLSNITTAASHDTLTSANAATQP
jgi:hypothetical protein